MNRTCINCKEVEVDSLFAICDTCYGKKIEEKEKKLIMDAEQLILKIYMLVPDDEYSLKKIPHTIQDFRKLIKLSKALACSCKLAIATLNFAKEQIELSIGSLILDGSFESENDSGVSMLKLYIRDYEDQIGYINKVYLP